MDFLTETLTLGDAGAEGQRNCVATFSGDELCRVQVCALYLVCLFTSRDRHGRFTGIVVQCGTLKRLPKLRVGLEFGLFG